MIGILGIMRLGRIEPAQEESPQRAGQVPVAGKSGCPDEDQPSKPADVVQENSADAK